jgi:hypothetical protein
MRTLGFKNPVAIQAMTAHRIAKADKIANGYQQSGEKKCGHCGVVQPISEFRGTRNQSGNVRYATWCRNCGVIQRRDRRQKEYYNLSPEDSEKIVAYQNQTCAICKTPMMRFFRLLATDHDHKTGLIRGKVCWFCNKLLAIANDDPERLLSAALYLISPPAVAALGEARFGLPGRSGTKKQKKVAKELKKNPIVQTFTPKDPIEWLRSMIRYLEDPPAREILQEIT